MMHELHSQQGAVMNIDLLKSKRVQQFISTHAALLDQATDSQLKDADVSLAQLLHRSNYIFSGMKTFHELNEAFPSLTDENGIRKPFERFLNDVQSIHQTYNRNYLQAEYNFAVASAASARRWMEVEKDGDAFLLQYRTMNDDLVRPEHAALHGITLPPSDSFWDSYYPPNGWNCRCTAVQVRREKYRQTDTAEAVRRAVQATAKDTKGIFRFNPGKQRKTFPDYNPYTISRCRDCDIAKGKQNLSAPAANEVCQACIMLRDLKNQESHRRLTQEERETIRKSAVKWANKHLPKVLMPDGHEAARLTVKTLDGFELVVGKRFINKTYSLNKNSNRLAETMELATHVCEWAKNATKVRVELGKHHDYNFYVFRTEYAGREIEFKAKDTDGIIAYTMYIK